MTERLRDLWSEVSRGEKVLAAGLALIVSGFSLTGAGLVLVLSGDQFLADPLLLTAGGGLVVVGAVVMVVAGVVNERDERRLRRDRLEQEARR